MISLRPYQSALVDALYAHAVAGHRAILIQSPVGSGKGACIVHLTGRSVARNKRALVIVPRIVLGEDLVSRHRAAGVHAGLIQADSATDDGAPVQVATWQTLSARATRPRADFIVVDEARHVASPAMRAVLAWYPDAYLAGFDATPQRSDGLALEVFTALVQGPSIHDLTRDGHLVPVRVFAPADVLEPGVIAQNPLDAYDAHAPGSRALVFATDIAAARAIHDDARLRGIACELLLGETTRARREGLVDRVTSGETRMLVNVGVAVEGFDLPAIECVILARGADHVSVWIQLIGRGMRPSLATGKTHCDVLDLRGSVHLHGLPDADRTWTLDGRNGARTKATPTFRCLECGAVFEDRGPCPRCGTAATVRKMRPMRSAAEKLARIEAIDDPAERARAKWTALLRQVHAWAPRERVQRIAAAQWRKRENCEPPR